MDMSGSYRLSALNPPERYAIASEGRGGIAGFARGGASVRLSAEDSVARKTADPFFTSFAERLGVATTDEA